MFPEIRKFPEISPAEAQQDKKVHHCIKPEMRPVMIGESH